MVKGAVEHECRSGARQRDNGTIRVSRAWPYSPLRLPLSGGYSRATRGADCDEPLLSMNAEHPHRRLVAAVEEIAASGRDGAVLMFEAEGSSLERLRQGGASDEQVAAIFLEAPRVAGSLVPNAEWVRTGWSRFECAVPGDREALGDSARTLIKGLLCHPDFCSLRWRATLTRIFPGEALRTLVCDPGYDLAAAKTWVVAWVDPYAGDDWKESQRYPTTTILWED